MGRARGRGHDVHADRGAGRPAGPGTVLATWLLIDWGRPRWYVPALVCVLLTWIMVSDSIVLFTGIGPLAVAAGVRAFRRGGWQARGDELSLAGAALVAGGLGMLVPKMIARLGGYQFLPFQTRTMPLAKLPRDAWNTVQAVLELFGANVVEPHPVVETVLVWIHLAGVLLAMAGLVIAVVRFFREDGILVPALAVAIIMELGAFLVSIHSSNLAGIREIVAVMPLGAVLAGRLLAEPLRRAWLARRTWLAPAAAVVAATWLTRHGLTSGLAGYWQAGSVTLDTGGRVQVHSVIVGRDGKVGVSLWETDNTQYDPSLHSATFVVAGGPVSVAPPVPGLAEAAERSFGLPARVYHVNGYTILVWNKNILRDLPRWARELP